MFFQESHVRLCPYRSSNSTLLSWTGSSNKNILGLSNNRSPKLLQEQATAHHTLWFHIKKGMKKEKETMNNLRIDEETCVASRLLLISLGTP
jgi:hypothetical protein